MKKISKKFLLGLISIIVFSTVAIVWACGWTFDSDETYYRIFSPEVSYAEKYKPFFRSFHSLYNEYKLNNINDFDSINVDEWSRFFKSFPKKNDLHYLLYEARIGEIDTLIFYLKDNKQSITNKLRSNSIVNFPDKGLTNEFLFYLGFARRCEPYCTYTADWYWDSAKNELKQKDDIRKNVVNINKLANAALKQLKSVKNDFIWERYIFQIIRLNYQAKNYKECLDIYQTNKSKIGISESMKYRTMSYAAGSLFAMNKIGEANYIYSKIYDEYAPMKTTAYFSFKPQEENDWNTLLSYAKSPREKSILWQLLGIYADPLRSMKEIYQIDPKSDLLDLLLVRAISIQEEKFLPVRYSYERTDFLYSIKTMNVDNELLGFIKKVADRGNSNKPYLWNLGAGYLSFAKSDYSSAENYLSKAKQQAKDDSFVSGQIRLIDFARMIEQQTNIDEKFESNIVKEFNWISGNKTKPSLGLEALKFESIFDWGLKRLSEKYKAQGDFVKAQCLNYGADEKFFDDDKKASLMIGYMDKQNKTKFDEFVLSGYQYSRNDIFEFQAVNLTLQGKIEEAIQKFEASKGSGNTELLGDPFIIHINDCHDCDHALQQKHKYTKLSFLKRIAELKSLIQNDPKNSSKYYFELANGFYNITYFGNARVFYETNIRTYGTVFLEYDFSDKKIPILNCKYAEEYYTKAMESSNDSEFKAKCNFMLAKCEQNNFYLTKPKDYKGNFKSGKYFNSLKTSYSSTKYYQEIIKECGYFKTYLSSSK